MVHRRGIQRPTHLSLGCWGSCSICELGSWIGSSMVLQRPTHCLWGSCSICVGRGSAHLRHCREILRVTKKAIEKDLVAEKMDRILFTVLSADISFTSGWFETLWRGSAGLVDGSAGRASWARRRLVVKEARPSPPFCVLMCGKSRRILRL